MTKREIGPHIEFNNDPAEVDGWAIRIGRVYITKTPAQRIPRITRAAE